MLKTEIDTSGPFVLAKLCGDLRSPDTEQFTEDLQDHVSGDHAKLVIDLTGLTMIDSTGLSALISLVTRARLSQGRVLLVAPPPLVSGVLNVTRLDTWFDICHTLDEASRRFTQG